MFLTAPVQQFKLLNTRVEELAEKEKHIRESFTVDNTGQKLQETEILQIQHGPRISGVISSDYVRTLDITKRLPMARSFRSLEYARARPMLTIQQYQEKNRKYKEGMNKNKPVFVRVSSDWNKKRMTISCTIQ